MLITHHHGIALMNGMRTHAVPQQNRRVTC